MLIICFTQSSETILFEKNLGHSHNYKTYYLIVSYQNLNSGSLLMKGRNSSFAFVGSVGPSSSAIKHKKTYSITLTAIYFFMLDLIKSIPCRNCFHHPVSYETMLLIWFGLFPTTSTLPPPSQIIALLSCMLENELHTDKSQFNKVQIIAILVTNKHQVYFYLETKQFNQPTNLASTCLQSPCLIVPYDLSYL